MGFSEKIIIASILNKTFYKKPRIKNLRIISFSDLYGYLNKDERYFLKTFLKINPRKFGFKGKYLGKSKIPHGLVLIKNQKYKFGGKIKIISSQYLLRTTYKTYQKLNAAIKKETGGELLIASAYRSPAYQAIIFLYYLNLNNFNFKRTAKRVAFPYYSEHGDPKAQAIDFIARSAALRGKSNDFFEKTKEYKWLIRNAGRFGFKLSYPKRNKSGIMFEPWHWRLV
ncbi:MAG: D-alanyl-D-alanine carboxypeptidase family protein [Patescibacteria group bacterium]|nr:D-alanyl-D-alanine carboxypeptidase family protein [Patescibacteria group bacterium]